MKTIEKEFNIQTGEETVLERELTKQEIAKRKEIEKAQTEAHAEAEAKETARQAILDRLGLTADEAALILG